MGRQSCVQLILNGIESNYWVGPEKCIGEVINRDSMAIDYGGGGVAETGTA